MIQQRTSADATRKKILTVARKLFVKNGFAGTSISEIAKLAKINQSLIYHHFQDKQGLWKNVKHSVLDDYAKSHEFKKFEELMNFKFDTFLEYILTQRFNIYLANPDIVRMISWQRLEANKKELQYGCYAPEEMWREAIQGFQKRGEIRKDVAPEVVMIMIHNAVAGLFLDHYAIFEKTDHKDSDKKEYLNMIISCLQRALMKGNKSHEKK
jgi:AcrR family transcriptional regulator